MVTSILNVMNYNNNNNVYATETFIWVLSYLEYNKKTLKLFNNKHKLTLYTLWVNRLKKKMGELNAFIALNNWGYTDENIFCDEIINNFDYFQACKYFEKYMQFIIPTKIKKLSKRQQRGAELYKNGIRSISIDEGYNVVETDDIRLLVIRDKDNANPMVYIMTGSWNEKQINDLRCVYAYENKSNYFKASPILFSTCVKEPERFYSTQKDDIMNNVAV